MTGFRAAAFLFVLSMLTACGSVVESTFTQITSSGPSEPEASPTLVTSAICDFFAAGGPNDHFRDAAIAAIEFAAGEIPDPSEAVATRDAIDGTTALAARVTGDERDDLLTLADVTDTAAISGEGYTGWSDALNAFYVKYAPGCGVELAQ